MFLCLRLFYYIDFSLFTYASPFLHIEAFESDKVCERVCVYVFLFERILSSKYKITFLMLLIVGTMYGYYFFILKTF